MPQSKRAAASEPPPLTPPAPKRATRARKVTRAEAEKAVQEIKNPDKPRVGTFRGIELTLPPVLPASFAFDAMEIGEGDASTLTDIRGLIVGLVGLDQWRLIREKIKTDGDPIEQVDPILEELIDGVTAPYGLDLGKSSASATP
jgi:hypothetical protein